jgi:hypothetical protein
MTGLGGHNFLRRMPAENMAELVPQVPNADQLREPIAELKNLTTTASQKP